MSVDPEAASSAAHVTSRDALRELKELRQYRGITMLRVRERAPLIQKLAITLDEAARRQLAAEDSHVSAYYAIQCTVQHSIRRPDLAHILRQTLNFHEEGNFLDDRRASLIAEFDSRPKLYARLEDEAYTQLAGVMVAADRSPCRDGGKPPDSLSIDLKLTLERESDLKWLLTILTVDKRRSVQEAVANAVLGHLPDVQAQIFTLPERYRPLDDVEAMRLLLALALLHLRDSGQLGGKVLSFSAACDVLLSKLIDTYWTARLAARSEEARRGAHETPSHLIERNAVGDDWPGAEFHRLKARMTSMLVRSLVEREQSGRWDELLVLVDEARIILGA